MARVLHVATKPGRPLLVYDGDCGFCRHWIRRWQQMTGDRVDYLPAQAERVSADFPEIPRAAFAAAVQLIEPDGSVHAGAAAVLRVLALGADRRWPLVAYERVPGFAATAEWAYGFVARHRGGFSRLTRWLWGRQF